MRKAGCSFARVQLVRGCRCLVQGTLVWNVSDREQGLYVPIGHEMSARTTQPLLSVRSNPHSAVPCTRHRHCQEAQQILKLAGLVVTTMSTVVKTVDLVQQWKDKKASKKQPPEPR